MEPKEVIARLKRGRALAWGDLVPVFDHAIVLAEEAIHQADRASNDNYVPIEPTYPPLVRKLAESVRDESGWVVTPPKNEATCTCPTGDGSLRWPCKVHPPKNEGETSE